MADEKVRKALALLEQAGRMDIVRPEALGPLCPVHRASAGVVAAVMACSPPRAARTVAQEVLDFDDAEPGEQIAAQEPWWEEKAGPGAACRIASAGVRRGRHKAADASAGWCGGKGFAPGGAAAQGKQLPGTSSTQRARVFFSDGYAVCGGLDGEVETEPEVWRAEGSEGSSVEEVELVEGSDE
ncbi:hypothetical protein NDU88_002476 [Pleurodeles waltl]|uniref:Uncharacterized protein n=1 Tax=Pleurodeles waltl TaxID=8319 RepID=A0AAV7KZ31_PLEWA|nr:hypothetical protein NDU88_002476 [Pleurodeles waltl]